MIYRLVRGQSNLYADDTIIYTCVTPLNVKITLNLNTPLNVKTLGHISSLNVKTGQKLCHIW